MWDTTLLATFLLLFAFLMGCRILLASSTQYVQYSSTFHEASQLRSARQVYPFYFLSFSFISLRMSRESHTTTLSNVTEWIRAVQAEHPNTLRHVTDEALVGLQALHTAIVREIMQRAVDLSEEGAKKRKVATLFQEAHAQLGLGEEWEQALAHHHRGQKQQQQESALGETKHMTKAQRKKARKQPVDQKSLEDQERMFEQARKRLEQNEKGGNV